MYWERGEVHETGVEAEARVVGRGYSPALLRDLSASLHELSQPITVLLCTLEYGAGLDSLDEIKPLLVVAREASERLRETALAMRTVLRTALGEIGSP